MGEVIPFNPLSKLSLEQLRNRIELHMGDGEYKILWAEVVRRQEAGAIIILDEYLDDWEGTE